jgi:hypothetical protein
MYITHNLLVLSFKPLFSEDDYSNIIFNYLKKFQINLRDPVERKEFVDFFVKVLEEHQQKVPEDTEEKSLSPVKEPKKEAGGKLCITF